ncbi:TPA: hypothetical protein DF272_04820 [Candidatus Falkowbacteria bacterium]|nr:hypothetical protein [Candidatus Falkowbacteria bacterium]HLD35073.1 hypothetical protein [Patescibacteria group bacterium]
MEKIFGINYAFLLIILGSLLVAFSFMARFVSWFHDNSPFHIAMGIIALSAGVVLFLAPNNPVSSSMMFIKFIVGSLSSMSGLYLIGFYSYAMHQKRHRSCNC